jgi:hypothetical protein
MQMLGVRLLLVIAAALTLAACGGESSTASSSSGNQPPVIQGTPLTELTSGTAYSFQPTAADPDGDTLTFSASNLPSWASINQQTGRVTGTPSESDVGMSEPITISVSDARAEAVLPTFTIRVNSAAPPQPGEENVPPTLTGTPATTATVGQSYTFAPAADDANDDPLEFSITNKPSWATFSNSSGRLSGTPTSANVGTTTGVVISVSDGINTTALPAFNLQVVASAPANRPPSISGNPLTSITVGTEYSFRPTASDPDGNSLTFSIQNQPGWASFSTSTGRLTGTPTAAHVGSTANIVISVSDGTASASLPAFTLSVLQIATGTANVNWVPPTTNTDGSALTDLAGYRISYGRTSTSLDQEISLSNPGLATYTVNGLASGTWYFAVYAVNAQGTESDISNIASKTIP